MFTFLASKYIPLVGFDIMTRGLLTGLSKFSHILLQAEFTVKPPRKEIVKPPPPDFGQQSSSRKP